MSPNSTPDLSTYEGRRALWAAEMLSGKFVPYLGGGLRGASNTADGRPQCCCLGVATELILVVAPTLLHRGPRESYTAVEDPVDSSHGYLTDAAARWYGLITVTGRAVNMPIARADKRFAHELGKYNEALRAVGTYRVVIHTMNGCTGSWYLEEHFRVDDEIPLATLNDAGCPWEIIAGLITRDRIRDAKTGPVDV